MTVGDFLGDLLRLRSLYRRRGPLDGQHGITPDGLVSPALRWSVPSVVGDAHAVMSAEPDRIDAWRRAMGLADDPRARLSWGSQCPSRGPGQTHARTYSDPSGKCAHCGLAI